MTNKKLFITVLVLLCMAAACLYTIMGGSKPERPLIGRWETDQSVLGYASLSDAPDEVTVSFAYERQGSERREIHNENSQADAKIAPFLYQIEDGKLVIWQGTFMETYEYIITEDGDSKTMTLTKPDGTTILLTHISDHP